MSRPYAAINRECLVLGVGSNPDSACHDANGLSNEKIFRVVRCTRAVVRHFDAGDEVLVTIKNGVAYI